MVGAELPFPLGEGAFMHRYRLGQPASLMVGVEEAGVGCQALETIGAQLPPLSGQGGPLHWIGVYERFRDTFPAGPGRALSPAATWQSHQPGRSAVQAQDTLSGAPTPEHGYGLPPGANDVDHPTGREPGDELGQRAVELGGRSTGRESRRCRSQERRQGGFPQRCEADACHALQG
jgi:hypothetical protein